MDNYMMNIYQGGPLIVKGAKLLVDCNENYTSKLFWKITNNSI